MAQVRGHSGKAGDPKYYEQPLHMQLNFYLKSSNRLPLFFPGPIPSSPLNLDATRVGPICGERCAQGPAATCREGAASVRRAPPPRPPQEGPLQTGKRLSCWQRSGPQTRPRCPTGPGSFPMEPAPPGVLEAPKNHQPGSQGPAAEGTPQRGASQAPTSFTSTPQGSLGLTG